ncbi:type 4 prepilin-like proteins leader peptide-processing enzyme [Clostridium homopropionicum DSM 5847]|uniref:Type 4 prepilin-like proteins leader peptide-processing enzyme n=1 Tax=Clostridium homopropionicum DSM 5847 TaxID=1121318 RepID=A0A0L6Z8F8_9CLOT|nr:A24 family peptidase [Clostridium homopropionicum]KOA19239.1 type 4 prepilin-like proteins leader peptide-processing enzyme [Clostridium homopropionicum DSM 5847]SFG18450.1 leader peptidase (prepilin peptidase) / N-methyltransferase [Clostridium homopropionicum]
MYMYIFILIVSLIIGKVLNKIIDNISNSISKCNKKAFGTYIHIICVAVFEILFFKFGLTIIFSKAIAMTTILIIISFVDLQHRIIPDFIVAAALVMGIVFSLFVRTSFLDTILGMIAGGGILLLLSFIPNAMGGGDIKLMFAIGAFLGLNKTLWALLLAFLLASIISLGLIFSKIKDAKDYIPFGPFLALGSFISIIIFE